MYKKNTKNAVSSKAGKKTRPNMMFQGYRLPRNAYFRKSFIKSTDPYDFCAITMKHWA